MKLTGIQRNLSGITNLKNKQSTPGGSRTPNLLIRSQMLYPVKLRALCGEGGIRTLEGIASPLAQQASTLGHSVTSPSQRREWDSNPRYGIHTIVFKTIAFVRSAIPPDGFYAEGEGFEPSKGINPYTLSKRAHQARLCDPSE